MHRIESRKLAVCLVCSTSVIVQICTSALLPLPNIRQEKCKDYRPQSWHQQKSPPLDRRRQKSKLFASFRTSFTR